MAGPGNIMGIASGNGSGPDFTTRQTAWRLFATCWIIYSLHFATNIVREIYPALSIGDHFSFNVYEYLGLHPDIFQPDPGKNEAFINNNPGASVVGSIPYVLARPAIDEIVQRVNSRRTIAGDTGTPEYGSHWPMAREFFESAYKRGLDVKLGLGAGVMQSLAMAPLSALAAVVMYYFLLGRTHSRRASLWLALLYAFATPVFFRTGQLNQNVLVAHFGFFSFVLLTRRAGLPSFSLSFQWLIAGLLLGLAVVMDYSGLVLVGCLYPYALWKWRQGGLGSKSLPTLSLFSVGLIASASLLLAYQWASFGHPLLPAQHYMPKATYTDMGYSGMDFPRLDLLWKTAFDLRFGLFTSTPILLLALFPPAWTRRFRILDRSEITVAGLIVAGFFLFCAANQYGRMQFNTGVRHVVPVTPFLFLVVAGVLLKLKPGIAVALGVAGTYWSWCLCMYREVELGLGVLEPIKFISAHGPTLPWITTLQRMPQFSSVATNPVVLPAIFTATGLILYCLWSLPRRGTGS